MSIRPRIRRAFRLAIRRRDLTDAEIDEELRFHLEARVAQLMTRGLTPERAHAEARRRFGESWNDAVARIHDAGTLRERKLGMHEWLDAVLMDLQYAARTLGRQRGFAAVVVLTFVLGIGANATLFGVIDHLLLRPPAHVREPERLVKLRAGVADRGFDNQTFNYPAYKAIRDQARGFAGVVATAPVDMPVGRGEAAQRAKGLLVTGNYFSTLGVRPAIGRFFSPAEDTEPLGETVAVLSHGYWVQHFSSSPSAVGATIDLGDRTFTVIGVAPVDFSGLELDAPDIWIPMSAAGSMSPAGRSWATNGGGSWLQIYARLEPGIPAQQAADDAMSVAREAAPNAFFVGRDWRFVTKPVMQSRAASQGASPAVATVLGGMSIIVLLICCANVANLFLARGLRRRREIAVRLALGVSRRRLVAQLLTESVLLAALGGAAAILVAYWGGNVVRATLFAGVTLPGSTVDGRVFMFTVAVAVVTGLVTGLLPALQSSRPQLTSALKSGAREGGGQRSRARSALLIAQTALSVVLLVGAGVFVRSLAKLDDVRLGVDVDRVLIGSMDLRAIGLPQSAVDQTFDRALERVKAVPGVTHAAIGATVPFGQSWGTQLAIAGRDSVIHAFSMLNAVTPDYFGTLGARLLSGRDFRPSDGEGSSPVVIINEMLATRYWRGTSPVGRCIRIGADTAPCAEVIGVAENVRRQSIFEDSLGFVHVPLAQVRDRLTARQLVVRVSDGNAGPTVDAVRRAMQTAAPGLPFADVHLVAAEPVVRTEMRPFRLGASLFGVFGLLALVLAAVGIYGVISFNVAQRTQEMGVRVALGAQARDVAGLVVTDGVKLAAVGAALGTVIALFGARYVASMLYDVSARDPLVIAAVAVGMLLVAVIACLVPAWRAMRVDAVVALRAE